MVLLRSVVYDTICSAWRRARFVKYVWKWPIPSAKNQFSASNQSTTIVSKLRRISRKSQKGRNFKYLFYCAMFQIILLCTQTEIICWQQHEHLHLKYLIFGGFTERQGHLKCLCSLLCLENKNLFIKNGWMTFQFVEFQDYSSAFRKN